MKSKFMMFMLFALFILFGVTPAFAWNCSMPGQIRIQVPAGTVGNGVGDGSGQVYTVEGITFECEAPPSNTPGGNVTGGSSSSSSTATGGNATANNSQNQSSQSSAASSAAGGNNSNNTTVLAPKIPVMQAAPVILPSATCFKGYGGSVQTMPVGVSFGAGKIDDNCARLEAARSLMVVSKIAYCKVMLSDKYVSAAGVTLDDCMNLPGQKPEATDGIHGTQIDPTTPAPIQEPLGDYARKILAKSN